jgi:lipid kinase, YegS/Rv2252/BmrU family
MKNLHIIINPISGTGSKDAVPSFAKDIFPSDQFHTVLHTTEYAGHASELTRKVLNEGADYVVAVGGDGTVNEIAGAMVHSDAAFGIIPSGSGNGLARDLGIPIDFRKAMEVIAKGNIMCIDYCKADEHTFFCTCGFGFDALISERFSEEKHRGPITYVKNILSEFPKFHPENYEIRFSENNSFIGKAFLLTCANATQYGNNAFIAPQADMQDGKMDVVVVSPLNPLEAGPMAVQLFTKQINKNGKLHHYQAEEIVIKREKAGYMHVDGDPVPAGKEIVVKTIPAGLNVIVPTERDKPTPIQSQIQDIQSFFKEVINRIGEMNPLDQLNKLG